MGNNNPVPIIVQGITTPVFRSPGEIEEKIEDGVAFGFVGSDLLIAFYSEGNAFYVRLRGEDMDLAGHMMAFCIMKATRVEHPSMGAVQ